MTTQPSNPSTDRSRTATVALAALGVAYVLAGVGLFYALAIDSMELFNAALIAILVLLAVSMSVLIRTEPVRSRENATIAVCVFLAMGLYLVLWTFTALPFVVLVGVLFVVGVLLPTVVLQYVLEKEA
ncbi:hypothetical protein [Halorubrum vacuolatum]|uniref:Uncharacterized protein n=1 Tax=Halorubrum vacuolatum TaxID=63740 RepID=A0A238W1J6_HALVU|nr:hypothetical protein [Halorubrum vacuolatum]SNR40396.1 hypothetical protein SAMN06264855_10533 [Halorubrum vacuolatum]